jgi:HSP20 family protein
MPWSAPRSLLRWSEGDGDQFRAMQEHVSRLFDEFFGDFGWEPWRLRGEKGGSYLPRVDICDDKTSVTVTVDLPGMEGKDVEVTLSPNGLTIRGEREVEKEEEGREYYRRERSYGRFHRTISLPADIDADKAEATFKKGVLSIRLPKTKAEVESGRRIPVKSAE